MEQMQITTRSSLASRFVNSTSRHIFLTGKAGTGKTTFLEHIRNNTHKNTVVAAPTGIAAINAGGVTLHSLFQLPFGAFIPDNISIQEPELSVNLNTPSSLGKNQRINKHKRKMLAEMELLIIDEVSMLRADILDAIDLVLRRIRHKHHCPFGGVQILFIGDLLQLPPVIKQNEWSYLKHYYTSMYFFDAQALQTDSPVYIELDKIFRQSDSTFIRILNHMRENTITRDDVDILNAHYDPSFQPESAKGYIYLTTHNRKADHINRRELNRLDKPSYQFNAEVKGDFPEHLYPVDYSLELREGAQVMFIKNDYSGEQRYFNGKIGTITALSEEDIEVSFEDGSPSATVDSYTWENKRYVLNSSTNEIEEKVIGTFTHYPVKLAWGITVHKSQGLTFTNAIVDVSEAFAPGQIYVALSRLVSLDGLVLNAPIPYEGLEPDPKLTAFINMQQDPSQLTGVLAEETYNFLRSYINGAFDLNYIYRPFNEHVTSYNKEKNRSVKQQHKEWALGIQKELIELKDIGDRFLGEIRKILDSDKPNPLKKLHTRVKAAINYFEPLLKNLSGKMVDHMKTVRSESDTKYYIQELEELERLLLKQLQAMYKAEVLIDAVQNETELTHEAVPVPPIVKERSDIADAERQTPDQKKQQKGGGKKGTNTRKISYDLCVQGKTIMEIAMERKLTAATIESHLEDYIAQGDLEVAQFVSAEKVEKILETFRQKGKQRLKPVKETLGDDYSYREIRFVRAGYKDQLPDQQADHETTE